MILCFTRLLNGCCSSKYWGGQKDTTGYEEKPIGDKLFFLIKVFNFYQKKGFGRAIYQYNMKTNTLKTFSFDAADTHKEKLPVGMACVPKQAIKYWLSIMNKKRRKHSFAMSCVKNQIFIKILFCGGKLVIKLSVFLNHSKRSLKPPA